MIKRDECLAVLARHLTNEITVAAYGAAFDWIVERPNNPLNFTSVGAMGLASSHGLGFALARPDRNVVVLDGDGSLLMNLGSLVTIANAAPRNLFHFVFENGIYEANGGHPIPGQGKLSFTGLAKAAGYRAVFEFDDISDFSANIGTMLREAGPVFVDLHVVTGANNSKDWQRLYSEKNRIDIRAALAR